MTPFEAIKEGILDGEIPDPFWTVTTTDTTQSWTMRLTAGAVYVFDWGDGQQTWHTGTGANEVINHTYASAGTYEIKVYLTPIDVLRFDCNTNGLVGSLPSFSACANLDYFHCGVNSLSGSLQSFSACTSLTFLYCNFTSISGTIPSVSACTSLLTLYVKGSPFTTYESDAIPTSVTLCDASNCALTLASVDAILADFLTNAAARPAAGTINLSSGTNSAPSAQGIADRLAFLAIQPGWTISVNP